MMTMKRVVNSSGGESVSVIPMINCGQLRLE